jgi:VWFA-related protein
MPTKHILILVLLAAVAVPLLRGQGQQPQQPAPSTQEIKIYTQEYVPQDANAIRVKSTMVPVPVVVRDSHGNVVTGLKKEDFQVFDEGKQQNVTYFDVELAHPPAPPLIVDGKLPEKPAAPPPLPKPRYIGMYFDDKNMTAANLYYVRNAAASFVRKNMAETDRAGIFTASATVTQQFTSNKEQLLNALTNVTSHLRKPSIGTCPNITPEQAYEISRFRYEHSDAFDLAVQEAMACGACSSTGSNAVAGPGSQGCTILVTSRADFVLSIAEQFGEDSLSVLGDVIRYMGKMPGRRTLIMASSGFFSATRPIQILQDRMIDRALRNGIVINTIDTKGLFADHDPEEEVEALANGTNTPPTANLIAYQQDLPLLEKEVANDPLAALADGTGGKFFHDSNDIMGGLREIAELPEVSYVLGFSPDVVKENGALHELKVKVPGQHDIAVTARKSYFAPTKKEGIPAATFQKLNREVMLADMRNEMSTHVSTETGTLATGESAVRITAHVDGHSLYFKKEEKTHNERVVFITALFDTQNHFLAGTEAIVDMQLRDATRQQIIGDGVNGKATLQAPPGTYVLREVMQEVVGGRISASSQTVEIR